MRTGSVFGFAVMLAACGGAPPAYMGTPGGGGDYVYGSVAPGYMRLRPEVCQNMPEMKPEYGKIDERALVKFLVARGYELRTVKARRDLAYIDVMNAGDKGDAPLRLRVAILPTAHEAGIDLHKALLEHGEGSWGVHRANVAVLAPIGSASQMVAFASKSKLACWGVLTAAGRDDNFVVAGGYTEL